MNMQMLKVMGIVSGLLGGYAVGIYFLFTAIESLIKLVAK